MWQKEIETMPVEQLKKLQSEKLVKQVKHVYENVEYYRNLMDEKGVKPEDIKSIDDLHKLPFLTKADLRDAYPYGLLGANLKDCVRIHSTSGTTGRRVVAFYTQNDIDLWEDCCARAIVAAGGNDEDICQVAYGYGLFTGGFGLRFFYKRWSMNMQFNYRYGSKVLNRAKMNAENMYDNNNQSYAVNWRWRTEGDITTIPRALHQAGYNFLGSDRFVEDGSFCRLNYLQIGYNLDPDIAKRLGIKSAMLSLSANNLFNWTRYSGVDPEVGYGGYGLSEDSSKTPRAKYFTCRLNVTF